MKKNFTLKLIILFIFIFFFSRNAFAASLEVNVDKNISNQGEIFTATILLNTEGQSINTIEGDLNYDSNFIKAEAINIGSSFVDFWINKPDIKTLGLIHFSGITPGGISTPTGEVFKVMFKPFGTGNTNISLNNITLYLNDGKGSTTPAKIKNLSVSVNQSKNSTGSTDLVFNDKIPPEKFSIIRSKDPSIFDNNYFIAFSTMDKGSGVDYYKICELFKCVVGGSPFLLKNQTQFYLIRVIAYDMNGNSVSSLLVSAWFVVAIILLILLILLIIILGFYFYRRYLHFYRV